MKQEIKPCPSCGRIPHVFIAGNSAVLVVCECGEYGDYGYIFRNPIPVVAVKDFMRGAVKAAIMQWNRKVEMLTDKSSDYEEIMKNLRVVHLNEYCHEENIFDCLTSLSSDCKIIWHPYPQEKPPRKGSAVLVTEILNGKPYVYSTIFVGEDSDPCNVIAWAELPEPYKKNR